jgi:hypothetical protein
MLNICARRSVLTGVTPVASQLSKNLIVPLGDHHAQVCPGRHSNRRSSLAPASLLCKFYMFTCTSDVSFRRRTHMPCVRSDGD